MLRCAVDVRSRCIRLALFSFSENEPASLLDVCFIPCRNAGRVLDTLACWRYIYGTEDDDLFIVGCKADAWPATLAERLEDADYIIEWIDSAQALADGVSFLESLQQSRRFMRATIMAHWPCGGRGNRREGSLVEGTAFEAQYSLLRNRLIELEWDLYVEGRGRCPGHLSPTCPDCEYPAEAPLYDEAEVWPEQDAGEQAV